MKLTDFIRQERESCKDEVLAPIIEGLAKYLAKELKDNEGAGIRWVYEEKEEKVDENVAFVYYKRKVALYGWLSEQGFNHRDSFCHLNGQITGIKVWI